MLGRHVGRLGGWRHVDEREHDGLGDREHEWFDQRVEQRLFHGLGRRHGRGRCGGHGRCRRSGRGRGRSGGGASGGGGSAPSCLDDLAAAANSEFCDETSAVIDCSLVGPADQNVVCGVALAELTSELERSDAVEEFAGTGAPDVSCFSVAGYPAPPGTSESTTVRGFARLFSYGCETPELEIAFFLVDRSGGPDDGTLGAQVGQSVVTAADCTQTGSMSVTQDCAERWECAFEYPNVPTETELAIRTQGSGYAPMIEYGVFIPNAEVAGGTWSHDVRALEESDYSVIPLVASGVPLGAGRGALVGEVHDCGDVRLLESVVGVDVAIQARTYFGGNEDRPLPDIGLDGTGPLGIYGLFGMLAGPVTVAAGGVLDGDFVTLGHLRVHVYANTFTYVSFRGLQPFQVPASP